MGVKILLKVGHAPACGPLVASLKEKNGYNEETHIIINFDHSICRTEFWTIQYGSWKKTHNYC
ncbi:MAG: hypothetical protein RLZZ198_667 [Bacteroidota bacterium]|jgi:hypothetical protein